MARPLRLEFEGAVYHLTSRGNERSPIYRDDRDRRKYLEILGTVVSSSRWILHAYCLMVNHYHLLVETPLGNLTRGMQRLNGRYTQYFNIRHRRRGHLYQGRYKAILVEKEEHLLELCRYVALNPVRARMVERAIDWPWSSYRATAGKAPKPDWLEIDWTLSQFARGRTRAQEIYSRFVAEGKGLPSPLKGTRNQIYLGGETFLKQMDVRLQGHTIDLEIPGLQRRPWIADIRAIKAAVAREYGVSEADLRRKRGGEDKMVAIYLARKLTNRTLQEIGFEFGVKAARASSASATIGRTANRALKGRLEELEESITKGP